MTKCNPHPPTPAKDAVGGTSCKNADDNTGCPQGFSRNRWFHVVTSFKRFN